MLNKIIGPSRKFVLAFVIKLLISIKGVILIPIIIKAAGETVYGGYVILISILTIIFGISSLGIDYTTWRYLPTITSNDERKKLFYYQFCFQLIILLVLSLLCVFSYDWFKHLFLNENIIFSKWLIIPYLITFFLFTQSTNYFRYTLRSNSYFIGSLVFTYGSLFFILMLNKFISTLSINSLLISSIITASCVSIFFFNKIIKEIGIEYLFPPKDDIVEKIKIGFPLVIWFLIETIKSVSDRYVISGFMTLKDVGNYSVAYSIGSLLFVFSSVIEILIQPVISKKFDANKKDEALNIINLAIKSFFIVSIPFIVGTIFFINPFLILLTNNEVASHASFIVPFISVGILFYGLSMILTILLYVKLQTKLILKVNVFAALFNLIANLVIFYFFKNILIAAITTLISYTISFIYLWFVLKNNWKLFFHLNLLFKLIVSSFLLGWTISYVFNLPTIHIPIIMSFLFQAVSFLIGYILLIYLWSAITKKDISIFKSFYV